MSDMMLGGPAGSVAARRTSALRYLSALDEQGDPDLPHAGAGMEWWYVNLHLTTAGGHPVSVFAAFFRIGERRPDGTAGHSHTMAAAWSEPQQRRYTSMSCVDPANLALIRSVLHHDQAYAPLLRKALQHLLSADQPPLPDLPLEGTVTFGTSPFRIGYGPHGGLLRDEEGRYHLDVNHPQRGYALRCVLTPQRSAAWQGETGEVAGLGDGEDGMRYYSVTRLDVTGSVTLDGTRHDIASGTAWYDHEWGIDLIRAEEGYAHSEPEWDWCGLHLDNGYDLSVSTWRKVDHRDGTRRTADRTSLLVGPPGTGAEPLTDWALEPQAHWTSLATCNRYPVAWRLTAPSRGIDLLLRASYPQQEVRTITVHRGFWEGRVEVSGSFGGRAVSGTGFVEVKPAQLLPSLDPVMETIGAETRAQVRLFYPAEAGPDATRDLIGPVAEPLLAAVPHEVLHRALAAPVRHTVEGAGKSWRSFAFAAVLEALGVDSDPYRPLLAAVELLHTGSLMVDDVQDAAELRRGRVAAHRLYGQATAINAGTAAYFTFDRALRRIPLEPADRLRAYEVLCSMLRAAHAGQALDIAGGSDADFPRQDGRTLGESVLAVHRLKTALPVRALAEIGAVLGRATPAQETALCAYFEALGLGYQIADDVFDLLGHRSRVGDVRKETGEDVRNGRLTYPLTCALEILPRDAALRLWRQVRARPTDAHDVARCVDAITGCGAADLALARARALVEQEWTALEPVLPHYPITAVLRSLGFYAVTRDAELNG
ncbi:polyprenyl synthetase family protein [Streptomyces sp. NPDC002779]|uniref:polyprenyl synthetase family protein n=1 Tax=Streptomyces sp. NPDC002779 TaxID=3364664 RepID=UPI0036C0B0C2